MKKDTKTPQLPHYITRFETAHSKSSNTPYVAKGLIITGPGTGRYITVKGTDRDQVYTDFLKMAAEAYAMKGGLK
jgi:hypothetical protein